MIAALIALNVLLLVGWALSCHTLVTRSRQRAEQTLLMDIEEKGLAVTRAAAGLPDWCRDGLKGTRGCEWWVPMPGHPSAILFKEAGRPRRLVAAWPSAQVRPVRMALLILGRLGLRSSSEWLPRGPLLLRRFLGWNRLKVYADQRQEADRLLRETDLGWTLLRATPARDKAFWYLAGRGFLLADGAAVSSVREATLLGELARRLEEGLLSPARGYDGSVDPALFIPAPIPGEPGFVQTGTYVTGEVWERFGMIAWMWFPYGALTLAAEQMRTLGPQAGCAALFSLLIVLFALFIRKHGAVARADSWSLGTYAGKHFDTDSDGTAYWVEYDWEGIDGRRIRGKQALMAEEWERVGPDWRTVVLRPHAPRGPFFGARCRHASEGQGMRIPAAQKIGKKGGRL
jgi:hypothetical protein